MVVYVASDMILGWWWWIGSGFS